MIDTHSKSHNHSPLTDRMKIAGVSCIRSTADLRFGPSKRLSSFNDLMDEALDIVDDISIVSQEEPQSQIQRNKKKKGAKSLICFSPYDDVYEIPHIDDFSDEEVEALWMSRDELGSIRDECIMLCELIEEQGIDNVDFCVRGLEEHTKINSTKRSALQKIVNEGVFKVMQFQSNANIDASQVLSDLYSKLSAPSVAAAKGTARSDAFAAYGTD